VLEVNDEAYLASVRAFADSVGAREQFEKKLEYLATYRDGTCVCKLYKDFAPHSFEFVLMGPEKPDGTRERWFNGGLVLHAPHSTGAGAPEFSVTLNPQDHYHWEVHT
jgi:hypothetical protein